MGEPRDEDEREPASPAAGSVAAALALPAPAPGALSTQLLVDRRKAREAAADARAPSTKKHYDRDWRRFVAWCQERGAVVMPADPEDIGAYLTHLAEGHRWPSVQRAYAAIATVHRGKNVTGWIGRRGEVPPFVRQVLDGLRRRLGLATAHEKDPAKLDELRAMLAASVERDGTTLRGLRDRALVALGFWSCSRRSELVALDVADLRFVEGANGGLEITLRRSKTDQEGRGKAKAISPASDPTVCGVALLRTWLAAAGISDGPVFRPIERGITVSRRLSDRTYVLVIKTLARAAGLDATKFAGHSMRAGFISEAEEQGVSLTAIMDQAGHTDPRTTKRYIRRQNLLKNNATKGMA